MPHETCSSGCPHYSNRLEARTAQAAHRHSGQQPVSQRARRTTRKKQRQNKKAGKHA